MKAVRRRRHSIEHDNLDRWLVSYADYMTLMFALFVVLYAVAMINEKPFETITESFGRIFQAEDKAPKNKGHGDDILLVNTSKTMKNLYGNGLLEVAGSELVDGERQLSNIAENQVGTNLTVLEQALQTALYDLIESGFAELEVDGDWLEIQLNSALLFPSGSSSPISSAQTLLSAIYQVLANTTNYVRIRGYTDNNPINNEIYASNWELSVYRATSILHLLEKLHMDPARMAIEGYGQFYPTANNITAEGRAKNRRVVIAVSKYGLVKSDVAAVSTQESDINGVKKKIALSDEKTREIKLIKLDNGAIRITTRDDHDDNK